MIRVGSATWLGENLRYRPDDHPDIFCYQDDEANCEELGALYRMSASYEACPPGWRLPGAEDWDALAAAYAETDGDPWGDPNRFGAELTGYADQGPVYRGAGRIGLYWTKSKDTSKQGRARTRELYPDCYAEMRGKRMQLRRYVRDERDGTRKFESAGYYYGNCTANGETHDVAFAASLRCVKDDAP